MFSVSKTWKRLTFNPWQIQRKRLTPQRRQGDLRLAADTAKVKSDTRVMSEQSATFHRRQIRMVADITDKRRRKTTTTSKRYTVSCTLRQIQWTSSCQLLLTLWWISAGRVYMPPFGNSRTELSSGTCRHFARDSLQRKKERKQCLQGHIERSKHIKDSNVNTLNNFYLKQNKPVCNYWQNCIWPVTNG